MSRAGVTLIELVVVLLVLGLLGGMSGLAVSSLRPPSEAPREAGLWRARAEAIGAVSLGLERTLHNAPEFAAGFSLLYDCSKASDFRFTGKGLHALAARTQDNRNVRVLVVPAGFVHGMARVYEAMANWEGMSVVMFQDRSSALEWLNTHAHV